jgi:hypothetical protein
VALSSDGNTAIIGAYSDDVSAISNQGSATVFVRSGSTWTQQQTLSQSDGLGSDNFGYSVALSSDGNTAIIGAYFDNVGANADQGSATVFVRSGSTWTQQQTLTQSDGLGGDLFGHSVALSSDGNTAIIGAKFDDVSANSDQGSATVFVRSGSTWTQQQTLSQSDGLATDRFGYSVALSSDGNTALIGAALDDVGANADQGSATVFVRSGSTWTQQQTLTQSDGLATDYFGIAVALSSDGTTAIIGAYYDDVGANGDQGSATVLQLKDLTLSCSDSLPKGFSQAKPPGTTWVSSYLNGKAGQTLLVCISTGDNVSAVTWNGSSLTQDATMGSASNAHAYIYSLPITTSGAAALTVAFTAPPNEGAAITASLVDNLLTSSYTDQSVGASGSSSAPSVTNSTATSQANELLYACISANGPLDSAPVWNNNFIGLQQDGTSGAGAASNWSAYEGLKEVTATGTYTAALTLATSRPWVATMVTYKQKGLACSAFGTCNLPGALDFNGFQLRWCDGQYWREFKIN